MTHVSLIVAMSVEGVIGRGGELPWRLSNDLRRFKSLTMGHHLVMGRRTYESIGRLLPGRTSIIVTRQSDYRVPGALVAHSIPDALEMAGDDPEIFVIGGGQIYQESLVYVNRMYVTFVEAEVEGDVRFPAWDRDAWQLVEQQSYAADDRNEYPVRYCVFERTGSLSI